MVIFSTQVGCMLAAETIVNFMILKEPNNYKIHRLRVIHLYEFDFNLLLRVKWHDLIQKNLAANNLQIRRNTRR